MPNFTRKAIKESFWKLLNERPLNRITVKDIVEDCGINRNSFYYHFQDLPALIEEIVEEIIDGIIQEHPSVESFEECLGVAITFGLQNKRAIHHIYNSVNRDILEKYLMDVCQHAVSTYIETTFSDLSINEQDKALIVRFYKCECFGQIIEWMNSGMKEDVLAEFHRLCMLCKGMTEEMFRRSEEE